LISSPFTFTTAQVVPHYNELMSRPASEVMTEAMVHVDPISPLTRASQLMVNHKGSKLAGSQR
jgi:hypothetical protein